MSEQLTPIKSTWKDPIGHILTDRRILKRQKQGYYEKAEQERALNKGKQLLPHGMVARCKCGETRSLRFLKYAYLPCPGIYCPTCLEHHRLSRPKQLTKAEQFDILIKDYLV